MHSKVMVLTAHGRGFPLIQDLALRGLSVTALDFTEALPMEQEDAQGPVGLFDPVGTGVTKRWELSKVFEVQERPQGFVVWTRQGPLEFRGPLGQFQWASHDLEDRLADHLSLYLNHPPEVDWNEVKFEKVWPLHLSNILTLTRECDYPESLKERWRTPLFSSYAEVRTGDLSNFRQVVSDLGVQLISCSKLEDVRIGPGGLTSLNIRDSAGVASEVFCTEWLSFLTRREIAKLCPMGADSVFENPMVAPALRWQRWRLRFQPHRLLSALPDELLVLEDLYDVWKEENFVLVKRTSCVEGPSTDYDVWMKVDANYETEDLRRLIQRFVSNLDKRIPGLELETLRLGSMEAHWALWPDGRRLDHVELSVENGKMLGPDGGERFDWLSRWHHSEVARDWLLGRILKREGEREVQP